MSQSITMPAGMNVAAETDAKKSTTKTKRPTLFQRYLALGVAADDTKGERAAKQTMLTFNGFMIVAALLFAIMCLALGAQLQAIVPLAFLVISAINLAAFNTHQRLKVARGIFIASSMMLPFVMQALMGGFFNSGLVMLWSNMALLGTIIMLRGHRFEPWLGLFLISVITLAIFDERFKGFTPAFITEGVSEAMIVINVGIITVLLSFVTRSNLRTDRKNKLALKEVNQQMAEYNEEILTTSNQLEEQHRKITDSIKYAKRIQSAILPDNKEVCELVEDTMVMFRPRDIVSGDFYWCSKWDTKLFVAVSDCTGHGVPGALMTMLGSSFLNQIVNDMEIHEPANILTKLDQMISKTLHQQANQGAKTHDGMDITLLLIDTVDKTVTFAGAKNELVHIREKEMTVLKGDKFPIGGASQYGRKLFTQQTIGYEFGDLVYMASDGYKDQFGGTNGSKFLAKTFREHLLDISWLPMSQQLVSLEQRFDAWKGSENQTDDVLVMGIKL